ncbi:MAG: quinone oxidoreductase [Alphaproteobacteria bacterium]|nr:quinone oxidoreductase [Alphaproteobacteria bacterium]MBU6471501.1 quinone oxidoreductase [Alphaproteobacteria bacterium]MDE2012259.1 quinone oxidoreductase [Alphaproteobacteria bacterium]MDE2072826.1 quinone oxidoreductase [Alphaproteobacteria bacterium]
MMKAIRITKTGGPEVLEVQEIELPPPGRGEVRVRHTVIGVNFIDTYHRSGLYPAPLPATLGGEAAGVVEAVGEGVSGLKPGDRVGYCTVAFCAYAEAANIPAERLVKLPDGITDEVAAAAMLKGMTAQYLLKRTFAVKPGQTILWHAAAGGVGLIACQWARHLGATVIGTVGSDEKVALAKANGCAHVLNTRNDDWVARVRELTQGEGVPVVYDSIGKDTWDGSLDCLAVRGLMASFGNASGAVPSFSPGILSAKGSLYLTRPSLYHYTRTRAELQDTADDLFDVIQKGIVKIAVHQRFKLTDARAAHEALHSRQTTGATVLAP